MDKDKVKSKYGIIKKITESATFALFLSVAFFAYQLHSGTRETRELVGNLEKIQNSLSTRYLGLFPEYIGNINNLLNDAVVNQNKSDDRDSIIIFEDVVYYGIRSDAKGFRRMMENLLTLTNNGCHVTMAFYDVDGMPFKQMIRDKLISYDNQSQYRSDMKSYRTRLMKMRHESNSLPQDLSRQEYDERFKQLVNKHFDNYLSNNSLSGDSVKSFMSKVYNYSYVDSILSQQYYVSTREEDMKSYISSVDGMLELLPQSPDAVDVVSLKVNKLCAELDSIKAHYMGKPYSEITYSDHFNMYKYITLAICDVLSQQSNIELLPLNESLMMCCWMSSINKENRAIFAFPSKYSTDEIGFISQDAAIVRYIHTMLEGIRGSHGTK